MIRIELSWPSAKLSPNARGHWATKANAAKAYRQEAWTLTKAAMARHGIGHKAGPARISYTFYPPTNRVRDDDNFVARMKPARDGMASALGANDTHWETGAVVFGPVKKGGMVVVTIDWRPPNLIQSGIDGGDA